LEDGMNLNCTPEVRQKITFRGAFFIKYTKEKKLVAVLAVIADEGVR